MKLLFDEKLSPKLPQLLRDVFPNSSHVDLHGLRGRPDADIWRFAADEGFTITSKDNDFRQLSFLHGHPPRVIWLSVGNAGTSAIQALLMGRHERIRAFHRSPEESLLVIR